MLEGPAGVVTGVVTGVGGGGGHAVSGIGSAGTVGRPRRLSRETSFMPPGPLSRPGVPGPHVGGTEPSGQGVPQQQGVVWKVLRLPVRPQAPEVCTFILCPNFLMHTSRHLSGHLAT